MATLGEMTVKLRVNVEEFEYALRTTEAAFIRLDRQAWRLRPRWQRWWMTLRRQGW